MHLRLIREPTLWPTPGQPGCTLGSLYVNGRWCCWTLEDELREQPGQPVERWKVKGSTAIPSGTYEVQITRSARFKTDLPLLLDVPGFTGIRIHAGNTHKDTSGCLLVGLRRGELGFIGMSQVALRKVLDTLRTTTSTITLTIELPDRWDATLAAPKTELPEPKTDISGHSLGNGGRHA